MRCVSDVPNAQPASVQWFKSVLQSEVCQVLHMNISSGGVCHAKAGPPGSDMLCGSVSCRNSLVAETTWPNWQVRIGSGSLREDEVATLRWLQLKQQLSYRVHVIWIHTVDNCTPNNLGTGFGSGADEFMPLTAGNGKLATMVKDV